MAAAALALAGLLLSVYLLLHNLGLMGPLQCGAGNACEKVQTSRYAYLVGVPVAAYGVAGYLSLLVVALAGLQDRWLAARWPTLGLVVLSGGGVAFTAYLKYLEIFRIHAICRWCVVSAVLITAIFGASLAGLRRAPPAADA